MSQARYQPPTPAAMTDAQLLDALGSDRPNENAILESMQVLERETELRQQDKADFDYWVAQMVAEGTVAAREALARYAPAALPELVHSQLVASDEPLAPTPSTVPQSVPQSASTEPSTDAHFAPSAAQLQQLDEVMFDGTPETVFALPVISEAQPGPVPEAPKRPAIGPKIWNPIRDFLLSNDRGNPVSQFWAWFGIAGTALPILVAALFANLGFSFGQSAAAMALGFIGSAVIVSVGSLAGKRSGLPTAVISRAAFGVRGNALPILPVLISKLFWVAAAAIVGAVLVGGSLRGLPAASEPLAAGDSIGLYWAAIYVAGFLLVGFLASAWGGRALASIQKFGGILGVGTALALIAAEGPSITAAELSFDEGVSNLEVLTAAIVIVASVGLAWVSSGADYARKLPVTALGVRVVGWALLGLAVVPTGVGIAAAAAFSKRELSATGNPLVQATSALPSWALQLMVPGVALTIVVWIAMGLYSTNLGLQAFALKLRAGTGAIAITLLIWLVAGLGFGLWLEGDLWSNLIGLVTAMGVPVAAWAGVFIGDVLLRRIAYHEVSLSRAYGFYGGFNWVNLGAWVVAVTLGSAMVQVDIFGLRLTGLLMVEPAGSIDANLGVFIAGVVGLLGPLLFGYRRIQRQEAEVLATEARRRDLADIFDGNRELGFEE